MAVLVAPALQELYAVLASWTAVGVAVKLDPRTVRRLWKVPGAANNADPTTREQIAAALEKERPFPVKCAYLRKAREHLTLLKSRPGAEELENYLIELEGFLYAFDPSDPAVLLEYKYMRMMVCASKALHRGTRTTWFGDRKNWVEYLRAAVVNAEEAIPIADAILQQDPEDRDVAHLRAILLVNWVQLLHEEAKKEYRNIPGKRMSQPELAALLRERQVLSMLKSLLAEFPYLWQAVYNGLELASSQMELADSTQKDDDDALWFYETLKRLDPGFQDFDYTPGEVKAISKEPAMRCFHDKYRASRHIPNKGEKK